MTLTLDSDPMISRLVHEAGYGVEMKAGREVVFSLPDGMVIPQGPDVRSRGNVIEIKSRNREKGLEITADTAVPEWYGDRMDNSVAVDMLLGCE